MSEPVLQHKSGAIAYECKFTIDASTTVLGGGVRLVFEGYASAEMMKELAGAVKFLTHSKKEAANE